MKKKYQRFIFVEKFVHSCRKHYGFECISIIEENMLIDVAFNSHCSCNSFHDFIIINIHKYIMERQKIT